jgi:hypothetical protein
MALELRNKVGESFGRTFSATLLFDCPTLAALADFLVPGAPDASAASTARAQDDLLADIAALSDEEAERLLERELRSGSGA